MPQVEPPVANELLTRVPPYYIQGIDDLAFSGEYGEHAKQLVKGIYRGYYPPILSVQNLIEWLKYRSAMLFNENKSLKARLGEH